MNAQEHRAEYTQAIRRAKERGEFHTWFNGSASEKDAEIDGFWDFTNSIARPEIRAWLSPTHKRTALEIGCGGGRILNAASYYFGKVIGLDIHDDLDEIKRRDNVKVIRGDGETIPLPNGSVDFVYSFIVFHHLRSLGCAKGYIGETHRVLKPGGLAHIYYGVTKRQSRHFPAYCANQSSISINREDMLSWVRPSFEVVSEHRSWRYKDGELSHGYQSSVFMRKIG